MGPSQHFQCCIFGTNLPWRVRCKPYHVHIHYSQRKKRTMAHLALPISTHHLPHKLPPPEIRGLRIRQRHRTTSPLFSLPLPLPLPILNHNLLHLITMLRSHIIQRRSTPFSIALSGVNSPSGALWLASAPGLRTDEREENVSPSGASA